MRVGFDAKRAFHNATGLGNYARDVLRVLCQHAPGNAYLAYNPAPGAVPFALPGAPLEERRPTGGWRFAPALWRSGGLSAGLRADGVELFHGLSGELPLGLEAAGVPGVVTVHDLIFERFPELYGALDRRIYRWKLRSAAARARLVVAISQQTGRDLHELCGVPWSKIRVVYQGCHPAFREPVPQERLDEVARRHGLTPGFVLQVGTIEPRKNLLLTVKALSGLAGATLVAVGRPNAAYAARVAEAVARAGLGARVRLLSGVPTADLPALYRLAAVAVYPSRFEGFGIPIVEALASGTPVVTTRGGVFPEAGGPGSAYVDPDHPEELRAVLASILADEGRRASMRAAGLAWAEQFRDERIAAELLAVYGEATSPSDPASAGARAARDQAAAAQSRPEARNSPGSR
jgi:glycosyltransferase involved in cell wall biosynthesis